MTHYNDIGCQIYLICICYYTGISKVKSAPVKAFNTSARRRTRTVEQEDENISMSCLETIVDSLLEIMEVIYIIIHLFKIHEDV